MQEKELTAGFVVISIKLKNKMKTLFNSPFRKYISIKNGLIKMNREI